MMIELDGIPLSHTQVDAAGGILEGRSVRNVNIVDERNLVKHEVPGMQGSVFQDLGRTAVKISFDGKVLGANAKNIIEQIRSKYKGGEPVPFLSDLSGAADVSQVVIDSFIATETAGTIGQYDYSIALKEFKEQPVMAAAPAAAPAAPGGGEAESGGQEEAGEGAAREEEGEKEGEEISGREAAEREEAGAADEAAKDWAEGEANKSDKGVNTVTGTVLDADGNPKKGVKVTIKGPDGEHSAETDEQGIYKVDNLPVGDYTAAVEGDEYKDVEKKLTIGADGGGDESSSGS
jgi:hypothetical protein